jgi:hypothetical protein
MMHSEQIRLEALKLALTRFPAAPTPDVIAQAADYANFVIFDQQPARADAANPGKRDQRADYSDEF